MLMKWRRRVGAFVALGVAAVMFAVPASAEGSFTSSFSQIVPGFDTRTWFDGNQDGVSTVLSIRSCRQNNGNSFSNLVWELRQQRTLQPDRSRGEKIVYCRNLGETSWGRVPAGTYFFEYKRSNPSNATNYYYRSSELIVRY